MKFEEWNPGVWNNEILLADVHKTLPGDGQEDIPWLVWLFENPKSPIALPGCLLYTSPSPRDRG